MNYSFVPIFGCQHVNSAASTLRKINKRNTFFLNNKNFHRFKKNFVFCFFSVCLFYSGRRVSRRHTITYTLQTRNRITTHPLIFFPLIKKDKNFWLEIYPISSPVDCNHKHTKSIAGSLTIMNQII